MDEAARQIAAVQAAFPAEGFFADKDWLLSPEPFPMAPAEVDELEKLGYRLALFTRACNLLYQLSVRGKQPAWIAEYLDRGKPPELIAYSRRSDLRDDLPRVIRPDLVLTEAGWTIAELDTVPGGIGLTAWLGQTYGKLGHDILGGADGMVAGFRSILPEGADILVSDEAATYRPEMQWLAAQLGERYRVADPANYEPSPERAVYRFFEMFDLPNVPAGQQIMQANGNSPFVTPPFKPYLEEKLWFALFWMRPLRDFWRRELSERHWLKLQEVIPYTWIVDPEPLPQHAVIPGLEINAWPELGDFSQKQRDFILKISGFSPLAWGSRGVYVASDLPQREWKTALGEALGSFAEGHPYILQRFHKGRLVKHPFASRETGAAETMRGRVRLCPYYFLTEGQSKLGGALATICPADKKLLHGMRDAILVPAAQAAE